MDNKIRSIGTVQNLDKNGYIINNLSLDNIQQEYAIILDDVLAFYKYHFKTNIHSIYLKGSVAKGMAIHHISDLDTIGISYSEITKENLKVREPFWIEMNNKYPYLNGIEMYFESLDNVMSSKELQFLIQSQCICIHGKNLRNEIPKFGIGEWAYSHSNYIEEAMRKVETRLKEENTEQYLKETCSWIMKGIVRLGFELVMKEEQCFTRDLYPCYELFSKHYPSKSDEMKEALRLAIFPTTDKDYMMKVIHSLKPLLIREVKKRI